jgi:shikimate dehydrogenase
MVVSGRERLEYRRAGRRCTGRAAAPAIGEEIGMHISGTTRIIAHFGYPTESFKAPLIYNPYFEAHDIDIVVVPMGCVAEDYAGALAGVARLTNFLGALVTMPHKVTTVGLLDEISTTVKVAGSCNAVRRDAAGRLVGDMFDGDGFVRGVTRKGRELAGSSVLVIGCGGVGSAIAASLAKSGVARLGLRDTNAGRRDGLCGRLRQHYPDVSVDVAVATAAGWDVIVNATPLGMKPDDALPIGLDGVASSTLVGEVVLSREITPFLEVARAKGCDIQIGLDMLYEQIPAYLEFFGLRSTTADELRSVARIGRSGRI